MLSTPHINLPIYELTDQASLPDGFNNAMNKLDDTINTQNDTIKDNTNLVNQIQFNVNQVNSRLNTIGMATNIYTYTDMIWIGDSYSAGAYDTDNGVNYYQLNQTFPNIVASKLHMNLTRYCVGGAGFFKKGNGYNPHDTNRGSVNYSDLANIAVADFNTAEKRENVSLIIISGGRNDYTSDDNDRVYEYATSTFKTLVDNFVNARIIYCYTYDYGKVTNSNFPMLCRKNIINAAKQFPIEISLDSVSWMMGRDDLFSAGIHPNTNGYQFLATCFLGCILGCAPGSGSVSNTGYFNSIDGVSTVGSNCISTVNGLTFGAQIYCNITKSISIPSGGLSLAVVSGAAGLTSTYSNIRYLVPIQQNYITSHFRQVQNSKNVELILDSVNSSDGHTIPAGYFSLNVVQPFYI